MKLCLKRKRGIAEFFPDTTAVFDIFAYEDKMAPVERTANAAAAPNTIWQTCFTNTEDFAKWDPDVSAVTNAEGGCADGGKFTFVMKEGPMKEIHCVLSDVAQNERLTFSGGALAGLMKFNGTIELTPKDDLNTTVKYTFHLQGLIGSLLSGTKSVVEGTEGGLTNIVKMSEEAQKEK